MEGPVGMSTSVRLVSVQDAYEDILQRTLSHISCDLARLVYLASTRDYNTGTYHHDGLAVRFSVEIARKALEIAHRQIFYRVSAYSLKELTAQVEIYVKTSRESHLEVLRTWQKLEPYRVAIPVEVSPAVARLFLSNIRLALAIFRHRQKQLPALP
jgi:hypothetical protein